VISSLKSLIKLFGYESRNYFHELVYLQPCLPSPAMALSLEWNQLGVAACPVVGGYEPLGKPVGEV